MWSTETTDGFDEWFADLGANEQIEITAKVGLIKLLGPQLKRPHADTLNGSAFANMKELRAKTAGAVIRVAFAFDPLQKAILLIGGDKSGVSEKRFYKQLIVRADKLYKTHLEQIKKQTRDR
jgi:hypothetical protein